MVVISRAPSVPRTFLSYEVMINDGYYHRLEDVATVGLTLSLLIPFVNHTRKWQIENEDFEIFMEPVWTVVQNVAQDFQIPLPPPAGADEHFQTPEGILQVHAPGKLVASNLMKLKLIKEDMKQVYSILSRASTSTIITSSMKPAGVLILIDFLLGNLERILSYKLDFMREEKQKKKPVVVIQRLKAKKKVDLVVALREQIKDLEEEFRFLRYFLGLIVTHSYGEMEIYDIIEALAVKGAYLLYLCLVDDDDMMNENLVPEMRNELFNLITEIKPLQHEVTMILGVTEDRYKDGFNKDAYVLAYFDSLIDSLSTDLSNKNSSFILAPRDRIEILIEDLRLLRCSVIGQPWSGNYSTKCLSNAAAVCMETGLLIYLSRGDKRDEKKTGEVLDGLFHHIEIIKDELMDCYNKRISKSWRSNFPSINELGSIDLIIKNVEEIMQSELDSIVWYNDPVKAVYTEMVSMRERFTEIAELANEDSKLKLLLTRFKDVAYHVEFVIDGLAGAEYSLENAFLCLPAIAIEIKMIHEEVKATMKKISATIDNSIPQTSTHVSSQASNPPIKDALIGLKDKEEVKEPEATNRMVGLEDVARDVLEQLTRGSSPLKFVSLVGMPGLGKTTLAKSLYVHRSVTIGFHVRAWCCISQVFQKDNFLIEIFDQIVGKTNRKDAIDEQDMILKLYQSLKKRRYLIVIDDIWDIEAWDYLKGIFPNDENGSRILFTTRNHAVALQVSSIPFELRLLSKDESRELLHLKLFEEEPCPPEFGVITKNIADNCKGLPLALVLIAGILKRTERKKDSWEKVAKTLSSSNEVVGILELSYKNLPDYLKPCFLYFGAFPEDTVISVSKLICLWISEQFVQQHNSGQSLEQQAQDYLKELIDRSLVMVAKRSSTGGVKDCHVHDLLRDFCLAKSEEEKFLLHENMYERFEVTSEDSKGFNHLEQYRLCICSVGKPFIGEMRYLHSRIRVRTLLYYYKSNGGRLAFKAADDFGFKSIHSAMQIAIPLLRVLDCVNVDYRSGADAYELERICFLHHLRYLAVQVRTDEIPSHIQYLKKLETFIVRGAFGRFKLPEVFWDLPRLRHVHITNQAFFNFQGYSEEFFENSVQLNNLKTISMPSLRCGKDEKFLSRLNSLQKLGCRFLNSWDDSKSCNNFPDLHFLDKLESLKVFFSGKMLYPCRFSFPSNLKKLTMSNFRLPWDDISVIGQALHNLEVLKLLNSACEGKEWCMKEGEFPKLKVLKLDSLDIEVWDVESEYLPRLEQLVVTRCQQLEEIPSAIGEIPTLQLIEIKWCSSSATDSVKEILEEQISMSNDQLKVYIVDSAL